MTNHFPINGTDEIELVGRTAILDRIWNDIRGSRPKLSVVGPAYIGKSVILKALAKRAIESGDYGAVMYWDFTVAPDSRTAFYEEFCKRLCRVLEATTTVAAYADYIKEPSYTALEDMFADMKDEGHEILFIWDSFDRPLAEAKLPAQLFGELREILNGQHQLVTATRAPLREIARDKEVQGSPFWNLFGDQVPQRVGCFADEDTDEAISSAGLSFKAGAKKELFNWTGGHPILLLSLLNELCDGQQIDIDNQAVNEKAGKLIDEQVDLLNMLWHDSTLTKSAKDGFHFLVENKTVEKNKIGTDEANSLIARGFAVRDKNKLHCGCRILRDHVQSAAPDAGTMSRLFGGELGYHTHIRDLLELRLAQFRVVDNGLTHLVKQAIGDIPEFPDYCLNNLTRIEEQALDVVWQHEFGTGRQIPVETVSYWTQPPCSNNKQISEMMAQGVVGVPGERYKQLGLLQILTGSGFHVDTRARYVTKDTYVLLNAIHQFRNRSEHADGQNMDVGVAVSALLLCIELLGCLARELE